MLYQSIFSNVPLQLLPNESGLYKRDEWNFREVPAFVPSSEFSSLVCSFFSCVPLYPAISVSSCYCIDLGNFYVFRRMGLSLNSSKCLLIASWKCFFPLSLHWWNGFVDSPSFWWGEKNFQDEFNWKAPHYLEVTSSLCTSGLVLFLLKSFSALSFPTLPDCPIHLSALSM